MSTGTADVERSKAKSGEQSKSDHQEIESSKDSSESSNSQSESGSDSDSSTESGSDEQSQNGSNSGKERSSDGERNASGSEHSNESYKSFNTSVAKNGASVVESVPKERGTPAKPLVKTTARPVKSKSPVKEIAKEVSPVPVTPAKALNFTVSSPGKIEVDFKDIVDDKVKTGVEQQPTPRNEESVGILSPGELSGSESIKPKAASVAGGSDLDKSRKRSGNRNKSTKKESQSPELKRSKKDKTRKTRVKKDKSVKKMERQMKQLQKELDQVRSSNSGRRKKSKKTKHSSTKSSKSKKSKDQSSDDKSSSSSASEEPTTSSRIGKISTSRKLRGLAMERSKQLGALRLGNVHIKEVTSALKKVSSTVFPTEPTQSYGKFYSVPGIGYAHVVKQVEELQDEVGSFVGLTAKLNLELAQELHAAKRQRVGPELDNEYMKIWQFENDLARAAVGPDEPASTLAQAQVGSVDKLKVVDEVASDGKKSDGEQCKKASSVKSKEASGNLKGTRKRKNTGSKTEEEME